MELAPDFRPKWLFAYVQSTEASRCSSFPAGWRVLITLEPEFKFYLTIKASGMLQRDEPKGRASENVELVVTALTLFFT